MFRSSKVTILKPQRINQTSHSQKTNRDKCLQSLFSDVSNALEMEIDFKICDRLKTKTFN